jgi:hypothetical protein
MRTGEDERASNAPGDAAQDLPGDPGTGSQDAYLEIDVGIGGALAIWDASAARAEIWSDLAGPAANPREDAPRKSDSGLVNGGLAGEAGTGSQE